MTVTVARLAGRRILNFDVERLERWSVDRHGLAASS